MKPNEILPIYFFKPIVKKTIFFLALAIVMKINCSLLMMRRHQILIRENNLLTGLAQDE
jgi:hypothetical protein